MDISTVVNIVLCILSFILALISIVTVVITLRQNHTMIENATRPYICVYGESINIGTSTFYLVIKNFGCSPATITKFSYEPDLSKCYGIPNVSRNFLADISKCTLAPGQSQICRLDYNDTPDNVSFDIEYFSGKKKYQEHFTTNLKAGSAMLTAKTATKDTELKTISFTLQEMLQKSL